MKKVLLIEDDQFIRENTTDILKMANYNVVVAPNGKIGVELALKEEPDIIISDIMMPVLDGYGVLHLLQKNPRFHHTPFLFLSAKGEKEDLRRGMELGADDYITKPFEESQLLNAIERRLKKAEQARSGIEKAAGAAEPEVSEAEIIAQLVENRNVDRYNRRQVIYREGQRPTKLYYLLKGKVRAFKTHPDGKELSVDLYKEGDFLGYSEIMENTNYTETTETIDYAELALIPRADFEKLVFHQCAVAKKFIRMLAARMEEMEQRLVSMAYDSLRQKAASALLELREKYATAGEAPFQINLARETLASIAGTATESLIRTLSEFRNEKLIEMDAGGTIRVLNPVKLKDILG